MNNNNSFNLGLNKYSKIRNALAAMLALVFALSNSAFAEEGVWDEKKNKNGIKVYTTDSPLSKFKMFKADTVVDAPIGSLVKILEDPSTYINWMEDIISSEVIKKVDDNKTFTYVIQAVPIIKDRHAVLEVNKVEEGDTVTYFVELTEEARKFLPKNDKYVGIALMQGFYRFTKISDDQTKVEMQAVADPAGYIPATIANLFIVKVPFNTLSSLQGLVTAEKTVEE